MKKLLAACLTFIAFMIIGSSVSAADFTAADLKIDAIKQTLEVQLERIRNATEKADTQMSLARMRIAERLRLSSEELTRQLEVLERLREQLSAGAGDSQQTIDQFKNDWTQLLATAFTEINSQVSQTNSLISQMETLRNSFGDSPGSDPPYFPGTAGARHACANHNCAYHCIARLPTTTAPTAVSPAPRRQRHRSNLTVCQERLQVGGRTKS